MGIVLGTVGSAGTVLGTVDSGEIVLGTEGSGGTVLGTADAAGTGPGRAPAPAASWEGDPGPGHQEEEPCPLEEAGLSAPHQHLHQLLKYCHNHRNMDSASQERDLYLRQLLVSKFDGSERGEMMLGTISTESSYCW